MKLLSKSEISKAKSADRQREVDEGVKLAKRVDALREVSAQEEASLEKFRTETIRNISKELIDLTTKRDDLKQEVRALEDKRAAAMVPLTEQWAELASESVHVAGRRQALDTREKHLDELDLLLAERLTMVEKQEQAASYTQADAIERLRKADILQGEAEQMKRTANEVLQKSRNESQTILLNAEQREAWVTEREQAAFAKEEVLRTQEIDLAKEFSKLKDREATLERNLKRHGI